MGPDLPVDSKSDARRTGLMIAYLVGVVVIGAAAIGLDMVTMSAQRRLPEVFRTYGWIGFLTALPPIVLGAMLVRTRPRHAVGWALSAFGLVWLIDAFAGEWAAYGALIAPGAPGVGLADWFYSRFGGWLVPLLSLVGVVFPDGRLPSDRRWRWGIVAGLAVTSILPATLMVAPLAVLVELGGERAPQYEAIGIDLITLPLPREVWQTVIPIGHVTLPGSLLVPLAVTVYRYRRSGSEQRAQIRWLMWAVLTSVLILGGALASGPLSDFVFTVINALVCAAITVAVTRHRLYDIDRLLPTTLVYAAMAGAFLLADMIVIAVAGRLLGRQGATLIAMALVAVLYTISREWLWRLARRLLLGIRPDSQRAVTVLARQLELAATPQEQLRNLAHTVARELRSPYVLVEVEHGTGERVTVAHGGPTEHLADLPVAYRGRRIGRLVLGTRRRGKLSEADQTLLGDLVRQAAAAAQATTEAESLQCTRIQLVTAREEERRRLRRDLHDGLGPTIAAAAMQIKAARSTAATQPAQADQLLATSIETLGTLMEDVRRLVYDMRPPALDELGLVAALSPQLDTLRRAGVPVTVDTPNPLPRLPAACEVAAYRILVEALTNVSRHAAARQCHLTIRPATDPRHAASGEYALEVVVRDDGRGIPASTTAGVGLISMRERAAELGGSCEIRQSPGGGTEVRSLLPYPAQPAQEPAHA
jgi:signal transduction histidine kinase